MGATIRPALSFGIPIPGSAGMPNDGMPNTVSPPGVEGSAGTGAGCVGAGLGAGVGVGSTGVGWGVGVGSTVVGGFGRGSKPTVSGIDDESGPDDLKTPPQVLR